jgi:hypothetical protein
VTADWAGSAKSKKLRQRSSTACCMCVRLVALLVQVGSQADQGFEVSAIHQQLGTRFWQPYGIDFTQAVASRTPTPNYFC